MTTIKTKDGIEIYYKDWGTGQPIVFSHGWPLSADDWDCQMMFFLNHGYRVIAHDRRGHGRSSQPGVYITAFAPDKGESVAALIKDPPPDAPVPPILPPQDGYLFLDRSKFAASFAADVEPEKAAFMADSPGGGGGGGGW